MYEAHITFERSNAETVEKVASDVGWKFSKIDGDPVMGKQVFCYLTAHGHNAGALAIEMDEVRVKAQRAGVQPVRMKIEHIIFDTKTGINVL